MAKKVNLSDEDAYHLKEIVDELIEIVAKFANYDDRVPEDYGDFLMGLDAAKFVVSGIVYKNDIGMCDHDHDAE